jgi:hypothetical protein
MSSSDEKKKNKKSNQKLQVNEFFCCEMITRTMKASLAVGGIEFAHCPTGG